MVQRQMFSLFFLFCSLSPSLATPSSFFGHHHLFSLFSLPLSSTVNNYIFALNISKIILRLGMLKIVKKHSV